MFEFTLYRTMLRTPSLLPDDRVTVISIPGKSYRTHQSPALWSRRKHSSMVEEFGDLFLDGEYYRPEVDSDYCLANIGNLDHLIPTDGDHARLAHLVRTTQCWNERICHMLHSLRGRLLYNLCYTSDSLTEQQARRFTDLIFQNLKDMI
ncbi:hypothetical protein E2C01_040656 [Portunus trituberculatus]|uniref:Uncharacterized protein n=1 Tax=Portunus trituberculatus TaxID=210409 RepID=A0A5B7FN76_PORTR|nr:hypothetical protein [Portunus trituberculatus]